MQYGVKIITFSLVSLMNRCSSLSKPSIWNRERVAQTCWMLFVHTKGNCCRKLLVLYVFNYTAINKISFSISIRKKIIFWIESELWTDAERKSFYCCLN